MRAVLEGEAHAPIAYPQAELIPASTKSLDVSVTGNGKAPYRLDYTPLAGRIEALGVT